MRKVLGFTLLELMIVVVIIAVLAAFAIPTFFNQIRKSRRTQAMTTLQDQQLKLERHRVDNASFATYALPGGLDSEYYTFALGGTSGTTYSLTATPRGDQVKDSCGTLTLRYDPADPDGNLKPLDKLPATDCW